MNRMNTIKYGFLSLAVCSVLFLTSCEEDINVGSNVDETPYLGATQLNGLLLDESTNKNNSVVELRDTEYSTNVIFSLSKLPQKGVDVKIAVDEAYKDTYNAIHNTDFELFPVANVKIAHDGIFLLAPDEKSTPSVKVTLTAFDGDRKSVV